jgi:nucleoside 2-deoxyribosyltransferase
MPLTAYISGALLNAADLVESRARYERFADACRSSGWQAYVPHQHADPERDAHLSNTDVARRDRDAVMGADVLIAYVGEPSLGVGAEVALALAAKKPVLLLAEEGRRVSRFLLGLVEIDAGTVRMCRYRTIDDACEWIASELRAIQQL